MNRLAFLVFCLMALPSIGLLLLLDAEFREQMIRIGYILRQAEERK